MLGCTLGHYHIVEPIGAGGMGVAYLARDERLNRNVVLKVLPPEVGSDQTARARLVREAQMASALNHPYICTIYEVGEENGFVFIAMEHIEGRTLASSHLPMGPQEVIRYGCQIAEALEHAHTRGIIHLGGDSWTSTVSLISFRWLRVISISEEPEGSTEEFAT